MQIPKISVRNITLPICVGVAAGICSSSKCIRGMGAREVLLARHRTLIGVFTGSCRAGWGWCLTRTSDKAFIWKIRIFCGWLLCVYYALFLAIHDLLTFWFGIRIWNAIGFLLGVILNNFLNSEINSKLSYNKFRFFSVGLNLMYKLNIWYFSKCWCVYIFICS